MQFQPGDRVFALSDAYSPLNFMNPNGTWAEYVAVPEAWLARVPDSLPMEDAGGVPMVGLTAWQALTEARLAPRPGRRLLVVGAAGGVGHMAVQVCWLSCCTCARTSVR
jgi:NADPH:quinone reductase-like Zn-dependent oxidoreductase